MPAETPICRKNTTCAENEVRHRGERKTEKRAAAENEEPRDFQWGLLGGLYICVRHTRQKNGRNLKCGFLKDYFQKASLRFNCFA